MVEGSRRRHLAFARPAPAASPILRYVLV